MENSDGQEKTEQASGKRLNESREKGQVAKSQEISSFAALLSGMGLLTLFQSHIGGQIKFVSIYIFSSLHEFEINFDVLSTLAIKGFLFFVSLVAPVVVGLMIIGLAVNYGQVGFKITPKALQPKFSKLNPLKGLKRVLFSSTSLVEVVKALFKLAIVGLFAYWVLSDIIVQSVGLIDFSVDEVFSFMVDTGLAFVWKICLAFVVIAAGDFAFQKFKHKKDLMMTKQEVKEENKQTEGDPLIKGKIKSKQLQMARSRMMQDVPTADVVITNPTHYAVALKYEVGKKNAPKVVAKGINEVAQRIKKVAAEHNVPLFEDVPLARALYKYCNIGDEIPASLYKSVAQILAYIFKLKNSAKKKSII